MMNDSLLLACDICICYYYQSDKLPFFIPKGKRTIPPDDEHGGSAESSNNKKNRAANFMENLEVN